MPRLQVLNGKRQGKIFEIEPGSQHVIGHRSSAPIAVDDPWVSWDHARIFFDPSTRSCWIEDLGSTNGTYVNCVRVKREQLRHEDIVFLGKTHVIFLSPAEEHAESVAPPGGDPFADAASSSGGDVVSASSSAHGDPFGMPSHLGPFNEESEVTPLASLRDPFQSTGSQQQSLPWERERGKNKDPWSDSSVDPFSAGPDFGQPAPAAPPPPPPPRSGGESPSEASRRAFAETTADRQNPFDAAEEEPQDRQDSLSISSIQGDEPLPNIAAPSSQEISDLIGRGEYDDLDALLGEPSRSSGASTPSSRGPGPEAAGAARRGGEPDTPPSEMRTRPVDTDAVRDALAESEKRSGPPPPPPPPPPGAGGAAGSSPASPPRAAGGPAGRSEAVGAGASSPGPAGPAGSPAGPAQQDAVPGGEPRLDDAGALAFQRAKLEDEVRRLRSALQAASQRDPAAVRQAAESLRERELGRLARRVADLEREVASLRKERADRQAELDSVTEDMIEKEDTIEALREELASVRGSTRSGSTLPDGRSAQASGASESSPAPPGGNPIHSTVPADDELPHGLSSDELDL